MKDLQGDEEESFCRPVEEAGIDQEIGFTWYALVLVKNGADALKQWRATTLLAGFTKFVVGGSKRLVSDRLLYDTSPLLNLGLERLSKSPGSLSLFYNELLPCPPVVI